MTALLHVQFSELDPAALAEYRQRAQATIQDAGAEPVLGAKVSSTLVGDAPRHSHVVVLRFPSEKAITRWLTSDDYQALVPLRDRGMKEAVFTVLAEA